MLSSSSMINPSAPLMLLTKTSGVPATSGEPLTGILTTVSLPVLATNIAVRFLLNASPLAPNGGTPVVVSSGLDTHAVRSEEHTSELQSRPHLVCRLLLEKKKEDA